MNPKKNIILAEWEAPEHLLMQRGWLWKAVMLFLVMALVGGGIYFNSWSFSLAVATFVVVYCLVYRKEAKGYHIKITNSGINIGKNEFNFSQLQEFWIIYNPPFTSTLNLLTNTKNKREITIQLNGTDPNFIRKIMKKHLVENKHKHDSALNILIRLINI